MASNFEKRVEVLKVDDSLGVVLGWAIICKENGEPYFDAQSDHIPEDAMFKAAVGFMENSRATREMHAGEADSTCLFCFPLTEDVAKAFGLETKQTGLLVGYKPPPDVLAKFKSGEFTGFSIGGLRGDDEEVT